MDERSRPERTPFDNPWFLPVLLLALALWFGYDGWFNREMDWILFNRIGFGVLLALASYTGLQALRETRRARAEGRDPRDPPSSG